jgi:undecaprenyl-phosphate 4-deoxy-4-formamido-L-arabinose transferase
MPPLETVSVVVPVYQGETVLSPLIDELEPLTRERTTPGGRAFRVVEVLLVNDGAPDASDVVMRSLAAKHPFVSTIWLSRNFGQHAATLAGMASTSSDWVVTLDEDGQQNPDDIGRMLDVAIEERAQLVYARPTNSAPHGLLRNALSAAAKRISVSLLGNARIGLFNSYRLVRGEIARGVAAYCGAGVYLDVAFGWVVGRVALCPVALRAERGERRSGYGYGRLFDHFWHLVLASGTRPLRLVSILGVVVMISGILLSTYALWGKLTDRVPIPGWTSLTIAVSLSSGAILFSLGIVAEYVGIAVSMAVGRPLYLVVSDPGSRRTPE